MRNDNSLPYYLAAVFLLLLTLGAFAGLFREGAPPLPWAVAGGLLLAASAYTALAGMQQHSLYLLVDALDRKGLECPEKLPASSYRAFRVRWIHGPFPFANPAGRALVDETHAVFAGRMFLETAGWLFDAVAEGTTRSLVLLALSIPLMPLILATVLFDQLKKQLAKECFFRVELSRIRDLAPVGASVEFSLGGEFPCALEPAEPSDLWDLLAALAGELKTRREAAPGGGDFVFDEEAAPKEEAVVVNAERYSHLLIQELVARGVRKFVCFAREGAPRLETFERNEVNPPYEKVTNQFKVLARLYPMYYAEPTRGSFRMDCRDESGQSVPVDVSVLFDDRELNPHFEISLQRLPAA
jgi:hypothetical protein